MLFPFIFGKVRFEKGHWNHILERTVDKRSSRMARWLESKVRAGRNLGMSRIQCGLSCFWFDQPEGNIATHPCMDSEGSQLPHSPDKFAKISTATNLSRAAVDAKSMAQRVPRPRALCTIPGNLPWSDGSPHLCCSSSRPACSSAPTLVT